MILCVDCAVIGGSGEGDEAQAAAELFSIVSQHTDRWVYVSYRESLPVFLLLSLIVSLFLRLRAGVTGFCVEGVKRGVLPFLRCAALFFNCLTGVPPPEELSSTAGQYTSYVVFNLVLWLAND